MNKNIQWYQQQVLQLLEINKYCPEQKTKEWYIARNHKITASEASSCLPKIPEICHLYETLFNKKFKYNINKSLSTYDSKEDYIINKCKTFYGENTFKDNIYTLHGKKYESIALRLYKLLYNVHVFDFGLLPHPTLPWLSASPDGITENGIMLEIKCPNKMYYIPSITYFTQMQIQMETANLDECDFLVCDIKELSSEIDFINESQQYKGIVLNKLHYTNDKLDKYIYPPDNITTTQEYLNWSNQIIQQNTETIIPNYYVIKEWVVVRIKRNTEWFDIIKPYLKNTIDFILTLQSDKILFDNYCTDTNSQFFETYNNTICQLEHD
jgi:putative phage-type endonuclease